MCENVDVKVRVKQVRRRLKHGMVPEFNGTEMPTEEEFILPMPFH